MDDNAISLYEVIMWIFMPFAIWFAAKWYYVGKGSQYYDSLTNREYTTKWWTTLKRENTVLPHIEEYSDGWWFLGYAGGNEESLERVGPYATREHALVGYGEYVQYYYG